MIRKIEHNIVNFNAKNRRVNLCEVVDYFEENLPNSHLFNVLLDEIDWLDYLLIYQDTIVINDMIFFTDHYILHYLLPYNNSYTANIESTSSKVHDLTNQIKFTICSTHIHFDVNSIKRLLH